MTVSEVQRTLVRRFNAWPHLEQCQPSVQEVGEHTYTLCVKHPKFTVSHDYMTDCDELEAVIMSLLAAAERVLGDSD